MKEELAKEYAKSYNQIRAAAGHEQFTVDGLKFIFKNELCPFGNNYVKAYVEAKMLIRNKPGKYTFPTAPVLFTIIGNTIDSVRKQQNATQKKRAEEGPKKSKEEECVEYLKSKGYKILKPETRWNEI